jgi:hypothetical protein
LGDSKVSVAAAEGERKSKAREGRRGGLNSQESEDLTHSNGGLRRVNSMNSWFDSSEEMGEMDEGISGFTEENSGSHFNL